MANQGDEHRLPGRKGLVPTEDHPREQNLLRRLNLALVAGLLRRRQPISRVELAERSRLGRSTITGIIARLMDEGLVVEVGEAESTGGRKPVLLELNAASCLVPVVRLSPRVVALGLADLNGRLLVRQRRALRGEPAPEAVLDQVATWVTELLREFSPAGVRVLGVGVALPGRVDAARGVLLEGHGLPWTDVPVRALLQERLELPVLLESDANAFIQGERRHGAAAGAAQVVALLAGAGVSGGLVLEGQIGRGAAGGLGALGHIQVDPDGPSCTCGQRGCLETLVSDAALTAQALAALERGADSLLPELVEGRLGAITRESIVAAAQDGDRLCLRLLEQAARRIGGALAQVANVLNPEVVLLGGDLVDQAGPLLTDGIRAAMAPRLAPWVAGHLRVAVATPGDGPFLSGMAELMLERVFRLPLPGEAPGADPFHIAAWLPEES